MLLFLVADQPLHALQRAAYRLKLAHERLVELLLLRFKLGEEWRRRNLVRVALSPAGGNKFG